MGLFDNFNGRLPEGQQEVMLSTAEQEKKDLAMVKQDGLALQHVKNQTKDIIVAAIKQNPFALQFVTQQPRGLCLAVVTRWPEALKYVRDQALGICLAAAVRDRKVLQFVHDEEVREKARCILDLPEELSPEIDKAGYAHDEALAACGKRLMKLFHVPKVDPNTDKIDPDAYELLVSDGEYLADFTAAEQTPEMCLMAMVNEPFAFHHVRRKTPELCKAAVALSCENLKRVREQTPELCFIAAWYDITAIRYIKDPEVMEQAVAIMKKKKPEEVAYLQAEISLMTKKNEKTALKPMEISDMTEQEKEDLSEIKYHAAHLKDAVNQTPAFCLAAVMANYKCLEYIKEQTPEMCLAAVQQSGWALEWVKEQTPELCIVAVRDVWKALKYVKEQTPELCMMTIRNSWIALDYVKEQSAEMCMVAVQQNGDALEYVREQTEEICMAAVQQNPRATRYIRDPELKKKLQKLQDPERKQSSANCFMDWGQAMEETIKESQASAMSLF